MLPSISQFRKWKYLSKFTFITGVCGLLSIVITILFWLFPDSGKQLVKSIFDNNDITITISGNDIFERQINLAKLNGISASVPSAEFAVAIPFVRPIVISGYDSSDSMINIISLSNASILTSQNQDIFFPPGKCRFIGYVQQMLGNPLKARAVITVMSCVMDNGDSYGYGTFDGREIGFLTQINDPAKNEINLIKYDGDLSIPFEEKYFIRFLRPLRDIEFQGKTNTRW